MSETRIQNDPSMQTLEETATLLDAALVRVARAASDVLAAAEPHGAVYHVPRELMADLIEEHEAWSKATNAFLAASKRSQGTEPR